MQPHGIADQEQAATNLATTDLSKNNRSHTMQPSLQASIWNQLIAQELLKRFKGAIIAKQFDQVAVVQPTQHLNLNQEFFVSLVPTTYQPFDCYFCPILQDTSINFTKASFSNVERWREIIGCFLQFLQREL
jgi:hypothetical protein